MACTSSGGTVPSDRAIRALHQRYAPHQAAFDLVHTHCEIVCAIAEQLIADHRLAVDVDRVRAGCLLHDIGVYLLYDGSGALDRANYVRHGVLGHGLLDSLGFPRWLGRFCSCHTGVGLTRNDVLQQRLPIPVGDYVPQSPEEELVLYADKFHSKTTPPTFVTTGSCLAMLRRFGDDKAVRFTALRDRFGEPDLGPLMAAYGQAAI